MPPSPLQVISARGNTPALAPLNVARPASTSLDDPQAVQDLRDAIHAADTAFGNALRKVVICGLLLLNAKDSCKHGEFGPWLHQNVYPELTEEEFRNSKWRNANRWMDTARAVCDRIQIGHNVQFDVHGRQLPFHTVLQLESCDLPPSVASVSSVVDNFLKGKTATQLQFEWRTADPAAPGGFRPLKAQLADWLAKKHPDLAGTAFSELPADIQAQYKKFIAGKPRPVDPIKAASAETAQNREHMADTLGAMALMRNPAFAATLKKPDHEDIIAACVETANFYRALSKKGGRGQ